MSSISVIIPTYKRGSLLRKAIWSALHQTLPAAEIIVVDDNRDEDEIRIVRECVMGFNDPRLTLISNFRRKGGCGARNSGILSATGTYIAFLDDDDIFRQGALQAHFNAFEDSVGMVYGN